MNTLIKQYCRESGVRNLQKQVEKVNKLCITHNKHMYYFLLKCLFFVFILKWFCIGITMSLWSKSFYILRLGELISFLELLKLQSFYILRLGEFTFILELLKLQSFYILRLEELTSNIELLKLRSVYTLR